MAVTSNRNPSPCARSGTACCSPRSPAAMASVPLVPRRVAPRATKRWASSKRADAAGGFHLDRRRCSARASAARRARWRRWPQCRRSASLTMPKPVEVFTNAAPAASLSSQRRILRSSFGNRPVSKMTLVIAPAAAGRVDDGANVVQHKRPIPASTRPMLTTMSTSRAPSRQAISRLAHLGRRSSCRRAESRSPCWARPATRRAARPPAGPSTA